MESSKKKWVSITLLSIIIPVGLLVTFRLSGTIQEPLTPQIIEVTTVSWTIPRPSHDDETISDTVRNIYQDYLAFIELNVTLCKYEENGDYWPFENGDGFLMGLKATANLNSGFVHSVVIRFYNSDKNTSLAIHKDPDAIRLYNVELKEIVDMEPTSFIKVSGVNQLNKSGLEISPIWMFYDQSNVDHQMTVTLEAIYFNGTAYREAVIPIQLEVTL